MGIFSAGGESDKSGLVLIDCLVSGNGSGVCSDWLVKCYNCTFVGNIGYAVQVVWSSLEVRNSIIHGNGSAFAG